MKITVAIYDQGNNVQINKRSFYLDDEAELVQLVESVERYVSDSYFELNEEV